MKKAFKKAISVLLVAVMMFGTAPLAGFMGIELPEFNLFSTKAEAATDEYYSYSVSNGEAEITDVRTSISGDIVIPSTLGGYPVTSIDDSAFDNCSSLTSVTIPDSVTTIGNGAFSYCISLEKAYYTGDIAGWCAIEFVSSQSNPVCYAKKLYVNGFLIKDLVIPEGVTSIGDFAFYNCDGLTSVIIPDGVTSIGVCAFGDCDGLTSVTIPDSVKTIGRSAFHYCISLEKVYYTGDIAGWCAIKFGYLSNLVCYAENLYINGVLIKDLVIPEGVTSIGDYAFYGYTSLTSVIIPDSVTSIGDSAFFYCSLESVTIPDGVTFIDCHTFDYCTGLTSVTIPKTVTSIEFCAFNQCNALKDVYYGGSKSNWENVAINNANSGIFGAKIHYNSTGPDDGSTEIPDNTPVYDSSVLDTYLMPAPTETTISYGDSIIMHMDSSKIPEGGYVEWYASNENFTYSESSFGTTCIISPNKSGDTTFTAIVYDAEGNIVSADKQEMTSKAGFFDKFIAFFKKLFGLTKTIPEAIKSTKKAGNISLS